MTANTERDAFSRLPEELRIHIIKLSPDLFSLRSLAHASPAMGRVLDRYPLEILQAVIDVTVPVKIRRLMIAVLKMRFSRFPASLSEAQKVAKIDSNATTDEVRSFRLDRVAAAVRSLLATAENVYTWSHVCLQHMIKKSMESRPSTLISIGEGRTNQEKFETSESRKDYVPQDTGPPSWVEEQRMIKAFWRLQFFLELQDAGNKGRLGTHWPEEEVNVLSKSSPGGFPDVFDFEKQQILTACDFFDAVTSGTITSVQAVPDHTSSGLPAIFWIEGKVQRYLCDEPPLFELKPDMFQQDRGYLEHPPASYMFHYWMSNPPLDGWPYLMGFPFQPWRKYGFAIWDNKRLADLGMRDPRLKGWGYQPLYCFRWWSILTEEDLDFSAGHQDLV
ncbi:hypothetical protein NX059_005402 [Plenodomus lindquistii]|nr:hypothetical protein NX059_005402 [Plenodomus lindquistii]